MTRFMNILASVVLAAALTPVAANATTMTPLNHVQIEAHKAVSGPLPMVQRIADNFDAAPAQVLLNQTIVHNGATAQMFPASVGG
jgi:hypothetical protein